MHDEEANQITKGYQNKKEGGYERKKDENSCSLYHLYYRQHNYNIYKVL